MKLILTQEVTGLGEPGDVVDVKDGYGRNFLLPRKLATPWTKGGQKQVDMIRSGRDSRALHSLEEAQSVKARLESTAVRLAVRAGDSGRLFGAVTPADIAGAVQSSGGPVVDRRKVELIQPIKTVGQYQAFVRLHQDVQATLDIEVVPTA